MVLPLISNVLPQPVAPQSSASTANPSALLSTLADSSAAARQQLAVAVSATGASAAYSPYTTPQRQPAVGNKTNAAASAPSDSILPDPEIWQEQAKPAAVPAPPLPPRAQPQINLPQLSQFTAQLMAQQSGEPVHESNEMPLFIRRPQPGKKPGIGEAKGGDAYAIALQRNRGIIFPATIEEAV